MGHGAHQISGASGLRKIPRKICHRRAIWHGELLRRKQIARWPESGGDFFGHCLKRTSPLLETLPKENAALVRQRASGAKVALRSGDTPHWSGPLVTTVTRLLLCPPW